MAWYFYYQKTPESAWESAPASMRADVLRTFEPPFTTILDLDTEVDKEASREDLAKVHYRGPLYFDFDSESIEEVIPKFHKFLDKLEDLDVDLRQVALYASGGKGFHVTIPMPVFLEKPSSAGYTYLPAVYREVAQALYVDTLDMRVYSARRGRMFRTMNVLRTNGRYKVQLSVEQARKITPQAYEDLTSSPGSELQMAAPTFCPKLALVFATAREQVKKAVSARRSSRIDEKLVKSFSGQFPATVAMIGLGEKIREGVGFQKIATQIAITANTLGQSEEKTLELCEGLVHTHQSDGYRYNTPEKRKREISRMYHYMRDNPCYEFSIGAIKNLLEEGVSTPDLEIPIEDKDGALDEDDALDINDDITQGLRFNRNGMFLKMFSKETQEHYIKTISELGLDEVSLLRGQAGGDVIGYEFNCYVSGQFHSRRTAYIGSFASATSVHNTLGGIGSTAIQMTDGHARGMLDLLRKKAQARGAIVTTVPREGVDLVVLPDTETESSRVEIIYAGTNNQGVLTSGASDDTYRLVCSNGQDGEIKSDLLAAPKLTASAEEAEFFDLFFGLHPPAIVARELGFYLASFLAQIIRHHFRRYPMLQVAGVSGAGKTTYNTLLANLHYYNKMPPIWAANGVTPFALSTLLQSSGSIPILFDEFKKRELGLRRAQEFLMIMRNNYTGNAGSKGKVSKETGHSTLSITQESNCAPLVFMGEEVVDQTAVMDRSIIVRMNEQVNEGDQTAINFCTRRRRILGQWGHLCVRKILGLDHEAMREDLERHLSLVEQSAGSHIRARPLFNHAVLMLGLELGNLTLQSVFGSRYIGQFERLQDEIVSGINVSVVVNQSEPSKVLATLAALSALDLDNPYGLRLGMDYAPAKDPATGGDCVEIHLRSAWDKYARYRRAQGEEVLYASEGAFMDAMSRHKAVVDRVCADSVLKGGRPSVRVLSFNLKTLYDEEGVEEFKDMERVNLNL